jgi:hypothetical protein
VALELVDTVEARRRLDIYESLNQGDPEIDLLRSRVAGIAAEAGEDTGSDSSGIGSSGPANGPADDGPAAAATGSDPFGAVLKTVDRERYRRALWEDGIFGVRREPAGVTGKEGRPSPEATVTLGRLYLDQGHRLEAETVFRTVLEAQPGNAEALAGLREATGGHRELRAGDLVDQDVLDASTSLERKRLVLESYRHRLRAGSARH